ncbi:MAG: PQQ-binding-like beta-propeller repeat protein [Kiritimatiellales bacterium]|nr:PQQ-binding-like beta-propeller repeat protein [Kiritimatiellales bacterium]
MTKPSPSNYYLTMKLLSKTIPSGACPHRLEIVSLTLILFIALASLAHADNGWTRFRGPNGSGVSDTKIPAKWTDSSYRYKVKLPGTGVGSPVIWNHKIYLLTADEKSGTRTALCLDEETGKILWDKDFKAAAARHHPLNSMASTTAAVNESGVFFTWGNKEALSIVGLDHKGKVLWQESREPITEGHGFGASPILYKNLMILGNDHKDDGNLIALDAKTGKLKWKIDRESQRITFSVPCLYPDKNGKAQLLFVNWIHGMTGVNPESGKVLWENRAFPTEKSERAIASPVLAGDLMIGVCGFTKYPKHIVALRLVNNNKTEEVWRIEAEIPHIPTPVVYKEHLFLVEDKGLVSCYTHKDGKKVWSEQLEDYKLFYGSPVVAGGKIFIASKDGSVAVFEASDKFKLLARNELGEECKSTPAITKDSMYIRTLTHLFAIDAE